MGKKLAIFLPLVLLFGIFETSVFPYLRILGEVPDLVLVLVCGIAFFFGSEDGLLFGVIGGLILDLLTAPTLGGRALLFGITGFGIGCFPRKKFWDKMVISLGNTLAAVLAEQLTAYLFRRMATLAAVGTQGFSLRLGAVLLQEILPGLLYDGIVFVPLYLLCRRVDRFVDRDKKLMEY